MRMTAAAAPKRSILACLWAVRSVVHSAEGFACQLPLLVPGVLHGPGL